MAMAPKPRLAGSRSEGALDVNSRVATGRRDKLMQIREREQLKDALTDKLKGRFGRGGDKGLDERSVSSAMIRREVDDFADGAHATDGNLHRLERRMETHAKKNSQCSTNCPVSHVSAYSGIGGGAKRSSSLVSGGSNVVAESSLCSQAFDWSRMDEYAALLHEQDAIRQKHGAQALQKKLKDELDVQVKEKDIKKDIEKEEEHRYHTNSMKEVERWKQMEQKRAETFQQKLMREKTDRDEQLAYEIKIKTAEADKIKKEEVVLVEKIVVDMEAERHKMHRKKEEQKKAMKKVFEDNKKDQVVREARTKVAAEKEAEAMREYNRILDEQEKARADELASRMEKQKGLIKKLQANVQGQNKSVGDNDTQRAAAQQSEMDQHYFEAEKTKIHRLKQMRHENQAYIMKQMTERQGRGSDEKQMGTIQARILQRDTSEYNEMERVKAIDTRMKNFEHRKEIEHQIDERAKVKNVLMSDEEKAINKPLVRIVHKSLKARDNA